MTLWMIASRLIPPTTTLDQTRATPASVASEFDWNDWASRRDVSDTRAFNSSDCQDNVSITTSSIPPMCMLEKIKRKHDVRFSIEWENNISLCHQGSCMWVLERYHVATMTRRQNLPRVTQRTRPMLNGDPVRRGLNPKYFFHTQHINDYIWLHVVLPLILWSSWSSWSSHVRVWWFWWFFVCFCVVVHQCLTMLRQRTHPARSDRDIPRPWRPWRLNVWVTMRFVTLMIKTFTPEFWWCLMMIKMCSTPNII